MEYAFAAMLACGLPLIFYLRYRLRKPRPADDQAIAELLKDRQLRVISVTRNDNYWRYWIRGRLTLSNSARIFVAVGQDKFGARREIHVAFDDWIPGTGELQILMERVLPLVS